MTGVQARHEHAPGGGADGASGVVVGEAHAFGGHAVQVGRLDEALAVGAEVAVAQIVGQDEDDVGRVLRRGSLTALCRSGRPGQQEDEEGEGANRMVMIS